MSAGVALAKVQSLRKSGLPEDSAAALWEAVRRRIVAAVRDSNYAAGEPLWAVAEPENGRYRLEVRATAGKLRSVELFLDTARARLSCTFGPRPADRWRFQVLGGHSILRRARTRYDVGSSVDAILGHLCS